MLPDTPPAAGSLKPLAEIIDAHAARIPDALAFAAGARACPGARYAERSDALASAFVRAGLAPGERVAVLLPDGPGVHVAFVATREGRPRRDGDRAACGRGGDPPPHRALGRHRAALARAPPRARHARVRSRLRARARRCATTSSPRATSSRASRSCAESVEQPRARRARALGVADLWLLNSTSGTTGLPKCVMHDQARWNRLPPARRRCRAT